MNELWSFKDSWILVEQDWIWLLAAFGLGIACGWVTTTAASAP